ncbi:small conductance mechanosensitive channel [Dyadobacter jejuensis]|uniref:Small conductance mechanosensitive channel n=1 Tax=Dyadobacter jejuensis TaxID=1082580 RepID=A0A316ALN0_9BACT|nr:mechanosensitive ion channel [Dyadobacter jejuensis]PWJ58486.1 small conductance mechanosensitive channel [Dyadobacter jejuensis]
MNKLFLSILDLQSAIDLVEKKINTWFNGLVKMMPNLFLSAIILVLGFLVAKWLKKMTESLFRRISPNRSLAGLFSSMVQVFFIGVTLFTVLSVLNLDKAVTSVLAGAGIVGLALAFAFQDVAANFISGVFISFRRPLVIGDIVKIGGYMGRVEDVNLRDTIVKTFQGQMVIIPNKEVLQNPIENYSLLGKRRMDIRIGVSYGEDLRRVKEITLEAVKDIEGLMTPTDNTFFYEEFGDSSINFALRLWVRSPEQMVYLHVGSEAIIRIKEAYDLHGIMIPFPIRTLDFGIKGGTKLSEMPIGFSKLAD